MFDAIAVTRRSANRTRSTMTNSDNPDDTTAGTPAAQPPGSSVPPRVPLVAPPAASFPPPIGQQAFPPPQRPAQPMQPPVQPPVVPPHAAQQATPAPYQPPQYGQYAPPTQPYAGQHPPQQFQPPKPPANHTMRNVLIAVGGGLSLLFVIGMVLVVMVATSMFSSPDPTQADPQQEPAAPGFTNQPVEPTEIPTEAPVDPPATTEPVVPVPTDTTAPTDPSDSTEPEVDTTDPYANYAETAFKSGDNWLDRPKSKNITRFNAKYDKPASWLKSIGYLPDGMKIVLTNSKKYNCGWTSVGASDYSAGGCYRQEYGKTLFMYWGKYATDDIKELILLHELSHFYQSWDHYDETTSAYASDMSSSQIKKIVETDATCRVYYEWDYTEYRYLDADTSSPCGDTKWSKNWMKKKFEKYGVVIKDW